MRAPAKLGLYGGVLVIVFGVAGFAANAAVPDSVVQNWTQETADHSGGHDMGNTGQEEQDTGAALPGLSLSQDGYELTGITAPEALGDDGELSLTVTGPDGESVTDFDLEHEKELHLIAVRSDGQHFRHVHPEMNADGTWSIPWVWEAAGSYRIFADFVPSAAGEGLTLSTSLQVAGGYTPQPATDPVTETSVDGYDVAVTGDLVAGETSELTMTITRDGDPVTELEPYLGAFGHLVALRDGDLAYLHVHPHGDAPRAGETSGPEVVFEATAPTEGRYLLYLDFQIEGQVHTAPLVLNASATSDTEPGGSAGEQEEGDSHDHG